jgi:hypothetical protein
MFACRTHYLETFLPKETRTMKAILEAIFGLTIFILCLYVFVVADMFRIIKSIFTKGDK